MPRNVLNVSPAVCGCCPGSFNDHAGRPSPRIDTWDTLALSMEIVEVFLLSSDQTTHKV